MDLREIPSSSFRRHPWEVARARFFAELVGAQVASEHPLRVLDIGSGDGYLANILLSRLASGSECTCVDPHYTDADLCNLRKRGSGGLVFSRQVPVGRWDLMVLLDVLEHVENDEAFLRNLVDERLESEGHVLISVPAFMSLYSRHDLFLGHYRRYRGAELSRLARAAGLEIVRRGGLFYSLLPVRASQKLREWLKPKRGPEEEDFSGRSEIASWAHGAWVTGVANLILAADNRLSRLLASARLPLPGLSVWLLSRKG